MGKYFGMDGVRGVVNFELILEFVFRLGRMGGYVLICYVGEYLCVFVVCDICIFGEMFEFVLIVGFVFVGIEVMCLGVIFILGVVYLIKV